MYFSWSVAGRHDDGAEHVGRGGAARSEEHGPDRRPPADPGRGSEEQPVRGHAAQPQPERHRAVRRSHPAGRSEGEASGQRITVSPKTLERIRMFPGTLAFEKYFKLTLEQNIKVKRQ